MQQGTTTLGQFKIGLEPSELVLEKATCHQVLVFGVWEHGIWRKVSLGSGFVTFFQLC